MQNELVAINTNTRETADNTEGIKEQFDEMNEKLENIEKNTKQNNSRG
jgi:predicted transcriptional regulator